MILGRYAKTPVERKRYAVDYSAWLEESETIQQVEFAVTAPGTAMATGTPLQVDAYSIVDGTSVVFYTSFGDDGIQYTVDVRITTTGGQVKEDTVIFAVRAPQGT